MAVTRNYQCVEGGTLVASGEGDGLLDVINWATTWAVGDSDSAPPNVEVRHKATGGQAPVTLAANEHLWVFGPYRVAYTGENAAPGFDA
ncbi:MAG: hypothetical protein AAFN94_00900 [Pseudomonadota bacterium]